MQAAAPLVLGVFHEQHAGAHPDMWDMVLAFGKVYPSAWHVVDMRKAVLPRLLAFLKWVPMPRLQMPWLRKQQGLCRALLCYAVLYCAVLSVPCCAVLSYAVPCSAMLRSMYHIETRVLCL